MNFWSLLWKRELKMKGLLGESGSFSAELIGLVEVV
jgi:hypothetical protein